MSELPALPGAYAIQLTLSQNQILQVGKLGAFTFPAGEYVYLGSARGPGGLRARLGRHLAGETSRRHWHIDYLRQIATPCAAWFLIFSEHGQPNPPLECIWSQALASLAGASVPIKGFGARDCRAGCAAHLVRLSQVVPSLSQILADTAGAAPQALYFSLPHGHTLR